jgi:hypothetical protein
MAEPLFPVQSTFGRSSRDCGPFGGTGNRVPEITIREETPADRARVDRIQEAAFGRSNESELVRSRSSSSAPALFAGAGVGSATTRRSRTSSRSPARRGAAG